MRKVINIAHRGYTRMHLENTLEALRAALDLGVDGVEFDVQETADGEFVIHHDDDIMGKSIQEMTLVEVQRLRLRDKYRVPTLMEALQLLGGKVILLAELKQVRSVEKVVAMLRAHTDISRTAIVSFSRKLIKRVGQIAPDIMRAVINGGPSCTDNDSPRRFVSLNCANATAAAVGKAHKEGAMVFVWNCPDEESVRRVLRLDIDGIISDYPDVVKQICLE